jgi:hypothetical protein
MSIWGTDWTQVDNAYNQQFNPEQPAGQPIINDTNYGFLQVNNPALRSSNFQVHMPELDEDDFNFENQQRLGLFGKPGGFGSGEGLLSQIGQGGDRFMGKFGTGEGKLANMDWKGVGSSIGDGLMKMGANMGQGFQYGQYGGGY